MQITIRNARHCAAFVSLLAAGISLFTAGARAQDCLDYSTRLHWVTKLDLPSATFALTGDTGRICTVDFDGLQVIDISDPDAPRQIGHLGGRFWALAVAGRFAYVAGGTTLAVIDLSNPASPTAVGSVGLQANCFVLAVAGDYVYACDSGLEVIDVSNPAQPTSVAVVPTLGPSTDIALDGTHAYLAHASPLSRLECFDLADPRHPVRIGTFSTGAAPSDIEVHDGFAYVAAGGLQVIDVSEPSLPVRVGSLAATGRHLAVAGQMVCMAGDGVRFVDVSDPSDPRLVGSIGTQASATQVVLLGQHAYVSIESTLWRYELYQLAVFDISTTEQAPVLARIATSASDVTLAGDLLCSVAKQATIGFHDVSDPASPRLLARLDLPATPYAIAVSGGVACIADGPAGLEVANISNPRDPQLQRRIFTAHDATDVAIRGTWAYLSAGYEGFFVVDISDPLAAHVDTTVAIPGTAGDVDIEIEGDRAYVGVYPAGILIYDLADPRAPARIGTVPGRARFAVTGNRLATLSAAGRVTLWDLADAATPEVLGAIDTPYLDTPGDSQDIVIRGSHVYVTGSRVGMQVVDFSTPATPRVVGSFSGVTGGSGFVVQGDRVFLADGDSVVVLPAACEIATPILLHDLEAVPEADGIRLRWHAETAGAATFVIRRAPGPHPDPAAYLALAIPALNWNGAYAALDRNVEPGTTYAYQVVAQLPNGDAARLGPVVATTRAAELDLWPAGPNPTRAATTLRFELPRAQPVEIRVYDVAGRSIRVLGSRVLPPGRHELRWDCRDDRGRGVASGTYWVELRTPGAARKCRITVVR
jgi:hypothetical protein